MTRRRCRYRKARAIVNEYLVKLPSAAAGEPLFLVQYKWYGGEKTRRMSGRRVWKIIKDLGERLGVDTIQPHAFRRACAVELLRTVATKGLDFARPDGILFRQSI